jgi:hypothetical protein
MVTCFSCGSSYLLEVEPGIYRCQICGQLNEVRPSGQILPRRMEVYPRIEYVREAAKEGLYEMTQAVPSESGIPTDMRIYINRVAEALTPLKGHEEDRAFVARALKVRSQFRRELTEIFEGKGDFDKWYNETASNLGIQDKVMAKMMFDSLEGLKSPEAKQLRDMYGQIMQRSAFG